jgi:DNA-binding response OmpR family regulator
MTVVLLSGDLMVLSRVEGAASSAGNVVKAASSVAQAADYCNTKPVNLLIADLSLASLDIDALVEQIRSNAQSKTRIVAFGPHVHEDRLAAARAAGCDIVMTRGQFFSQLSSVLQHEV